MKTHQVGRLKRHKPLGEQVTTPRLKWQGRSSGQHGQGRSDGERTEVSAGKNRCLGAVGLRT